MIRARGATGDARTIYTAAFIAAILSIFVGFGIAVSSSVTLLAFGVFIGMACVFFAPFKVVLYAFFVLALSGIRPLPPISGYHVQAEFLLLIPLLVRSLLLQRTNTKDAGVRWRMLLIPVSGIVIASIIGVGVDIANGVLASGLVADYVKWLTAPLFLIVLVQAAHVDGVAFAIDLRKALIHIVGALSLFTLVSNVLRLQLSGSPTGQRLGYNTSFSPNDSGVIAAAVILLILGPLAVRRVSWIELGWVPLLFVFVLGTSSREAIVGLAAGIAALFVFSDSLRAGFWYVYALAAVSLCLIATMVGGWRVVPLTLLRGGVWPEIRPYQSLLGFQIPSAIAERLYLNVSGLSVFLSNPLVGVGMLRNLRIPEGMSTAAGGWDRPIYLPVAHNAFITVAAQQGIVGLLPVVILMFSAFKIAGFAVRRSQSSPSLYGVAVGTYCSLVMLSVVSLASDAMYINFQVTVVLYSLLVSSLLVAGVVVQSGPEPTVARIRLLSYRLRTSDERPS